RRRSARAPIAVRVSSRTPRRLPRVPPVRWLRVNSRLRRGAAAGPTHAPGGSGRRPGRGGGKAGVGGGREGRGEAAAPARGRGTGRGRQILAAVWRERAGGELLAKGVPRPVRFEMPSLEASPVPDGDFAGEAVVGHEALGRVETGQFLGELCLGARPVEFDDG